MSPCDASPQSHFACLALVSAALGLPSPATAAARTAAAAAPCQKVCRLVCEEKKVDVDLLGLPVRGLLPARTQQARLQTLQDGVRRLRRAVRSRRRRTSSRSGLCGASWIPALREAVHAQEADEEDRNGDRPQLQMGRRRPVPALRGELRRGRRRRRDRGDAAAAPSGRRQAALHASSSAHSAAVLSDLGRPFSAAN